MADDEQDVRWKEFEELGEDQVRIRLAHHTWAEGTERLAREWLELRETSLAREANDLARRANAAAKEANDIARTNNIIATLALVGAGFSITVSIIGLFLSIFLKKG
jgi:DNA-binding transcriptional LysR family regulator